MFAELPKLFDRDFVVGFFLPAAAMVAAILGVLYAFDLLASVPAVSILTASATAIGVVWFIAVGLLAFNYAILRFMEGYPKLYPFRYQRERVWKQLFRKRVEPNLLLDQEVTVLQARGLPNPILPKSFADDMRYAAECFPDEERWVLPSEFGNLFRALEVYSRVIYGMDAIPIWPRLQAVLPELFRKQLGEAGSVLNFFVNITVGAAVTLMVYLLLAVWARALPISWIPLAAIAVMVGSHQGSLAAVRQYGTYVKSAFDLFRKELAKQLGLEPPPYAGREREMWQSVSKMMIFRSQRDADQLDRFRVPQESDAVQQPKIIREL